MTRSEFEKKFMNPASAVYRRAVIMSALAEAESWGTWKKVGKDAVPDRPFLPNDLIFAATYMLHRNSLKGFELMVMRDFLWKRQGEDAGYLVDPVHNGSEARKKAVSGVGVIARNYKSLTAASVVTDHFKQVYTEMWLPGGSLKEFASMEMNVNERTLYQLLHDNIQTITNDQEKMLYLTSLIQRFEGTGEMTRDRFGSPFKSKVLGLDYSVTVLGTRRNLVRVNN